MQLALQVEGLPQAVADRVGGLDLAAGHVGVVELVEALGVALHPVDLELHADGVHVERVLGTAVDDGLVGLQGEVVAAHPAEALAQVPAGVRGHRRALEGPGLHQDEEGPGAGPVVAHHPGVEAVLVAPDRLVAPDEAPAPLQVAGKGRQLVLEADDHAVDPVDLGGHVGRGPGAHREQGHQDARDGGGHGLHSISAMRTVFSS